MSCAAFTVAGRDYLVTRMGNDVVIASQGLPDMRGKWDGMSLDGAFGDGLTARVFAAAQAALQAPAAEPVTAPVVTGTVVMSNGREASPAQAAVFHAVEDPTLRHLVVEALAGCLTGDTMIGVNRAGKGSLMRLDHVVHMFNGGASSGKRWDLAIPTYVRAPRADGTVRLAKVTAATVSGVRRVFELKLVGGRVIHATADHMFLTPNGWTELQHLRYGYVFVEADSKGPGQGRTAKRNYLKRVVPKHPHAVNSGNGIATVPTHRLHVEAIRNGLDLEAFVWRLQTSAEGLEFLDPDLVVHHKDRNHWNNGLANLEVMTAAQHRAEHADEITANVQTRLVLAEVLDIAEADQCATYDLTVPGPASFMANGMAVHNSGKTTTIVEAMCYTPEHDSVLAVAFNSSIATELAKRVPAGVTVSTLHSYGLRAIREAMGHREVDAQMVPNMLREPLGYDRGSWEARRAAARLVAVAKGSLLASDLRTLDRAADAAGISFPERWDRGQILRAAAWALDTCREATHGPIDFDDMIWLPVVRDLPCAQYDWVFVDETQDLNPCQLRLVRGACTPDGGRIVAVGDRRQAIYGFRGADAQAIPRMITELDAHVLPLNVTYRCATAIVAEAAELVPALQAAPGAPEGVVREASLGQLRTGAAAGDCVISRTNAPLVALAWRWLAEGRRCSIKGRDLGKGLTGWIKSQRCHGVPALGRAITEWHTREVARLSADERPTDAVDDKAACLQAMCEGATSIEGVIARCEALFDDSTGGPGHILLTSTHRAKGLEFDRVWLLRDTYCKWPGDEEENLLYVAVTRAKSELIYVYEQKEA